MHGREWGKNLLLKENDAIGRSLVVRRRRPEKLLFSEESCHKPACARRETGERFRCIYSMLREVPGLGYSAAAQGVRRFWKQLAKDPEKSAFLTA